MKKLAVTLLLLCLACSVLAQKQVRGKGQGAGSPQGGPQLMQRLDQDGDGKVSRDEWRGAAERFDFLDSNKDGFIDVAEARQAFQKRAGAAGQPGQANRGQVSGLGVMLKLMDADSDGKISKTEFTDALWKRADADQSGTATMEDLKQLPLLRPLAGGGGEGRLAQQAQLGLKAADKNGDGQFDKSEFSTIASRLFDRLDASKDGFLTREELNAVGQQVGERARRGQAGVQPDPNAWMKLFARYDNNNDSKIDRAEWQGSEEMFKQLDSNSDGLITKDEAQANYKGPNDNAGYYAGRKSRMTEEAFERVAAKGPEAIISAYDKNSDGKVSLEESGVRKQLFMRYDKNSDGVIDGSDR